METTSAEVKKPEQQQFTADEEHSFQAFIIRCILKNAVIPHSARMGVSEKYTVQQLVHLPPTTLRTIGKQVKAAAEKYGDPDFDEKTAMEIPANSGIYAADWITFIKLCIKRAQFVETEKARAERIKELKALINNSKSKEEILQELKEELSTLDPAPAPISATETAS